VEDAWLQVLHGEITNEALHHVQLAGCGGKARMKVWMFLSPVSNRDI
jgi:hypothetical protein